MDLELLIACVHERYAIWQCKHKNHFNRGVIDKYWDEIASALQTTKDAAKSKWKNMKDQYRKELKKVKKSTSGDEGGELQLSKWPYFSLMEFLREEINKSQLSGNLHSKNRVTAKNDSDNEDDSCTIDDLENLISMTAEDEVGDQVQGPGIETETEQPTKLTSCQLTQKRKETVQETVAKKMLVLEEKKLELLGSQNKQPADDDSEDYHFLMSLLPHLKALPPLQKLRVRNKITQVVINEISSDQYYSGSASTSRSGFNTFNYNDDLSNF